jgi:glucokinase
MGFDIGGSKISLFLSDGNGKIHKRMKERTPVFKSPDELVDIIEKMANLVIDETGTAPDAFSVVIAGAVDARRGVIHSSPNLLGNQEVEFSKMLQDRLNKVVYIENDATAAAISEKIFGNGKTYENFIYLTLSTGIGGGIFINDKVYRGATGMAGEFGHMVIDPDGPICGCGRRGCFEVMAGGKGILKLMDKKSIYEKSDYLKQFKKNKVEAKHIFDGAESGDQYCSQLIDSVVDNMVSGIANLVNIFDPDAVMIGGGLSNSQELVLDNIERMLPDKLMGMNRNVSIFRTNPILVELSPLAVVLYEREMPSFNYERIIREMREKIVDKQK